VVNNVTVNRVSYNGGAGGVAAVPTAQEKMAAQEPHVPPTVEQKEHMTQAAANPALLAKNNGGKPAIAATPKAGAFHDPGVVGAHGAEPPEHAMADAKHAAPPKVAANNAKPAGGGGGMAQNNGKPPPKPKAKTQAEKDKERENGKHEGEEK
jgi:hypothetical protein